MRLDRTNTTTPKKMPAVRESPWRINGALVARRDWAEITSSRAGCDDRRACWAESNGVMEVLWGLRLGYGFALVPPSDCAIRESLYRALR
jgi:hypothetical protein